MLDYEQFVDILFHVDALLVPKQNDRGFSRKPSSERKKCKSVIWTYLVIERQNAAIEPESPEQIVVIIEIKQKLHGLGAADRVHRAQGARRDARWAGADAQRSEKCKMIKKRLSNVCNSDCGIATSS